VNNFILAILFTTTVYAQDTSTVIIVNNPFDHLVESYNKNPNAEDMTLLKIEADFNNDGLLDIAVNGDAEMGNAGTDWDIYLRTKDGKFKLLDGMFFHPSAITIKPIKKGQARLIAYHRGDPNEGSIAEYLISSSGIKLIRRKKVHVKDNMADRT